MCVPERRGVTVKEWLAGAMFVDSVCEHKNSSQNSRVVGSQPAKQQKRNCRRGAWKKTQGVNLTRSNFLFTNTWRAEETNRFLICPMFSMTLQLLSPSTAGHIGSQLPRVLFWALFWALFWGKELFWALFWVLLKVSELFWALLKALYFALFWNTFLEHFLEHFIENFFGGKELFWALICVLLKVTKKKLHFSWHFFWYYFLQLFCPTF